LPLRKAYLNLLQDVSNTLDEVELVLSHVYKVNLKIKDDLDLVIRLSSSTLLSLSNLKTKSIGFALSKALLSLFYLTFSI
jgi:hypothetical protein